MHPSLKKTTQKYNTSRSLTDKIKEELFYNGFYIYENFLNEKENKKLANEIDLLYKDEKKIFGEKNLKKINDLGVVRSPYLKSKLVADFIFSKKILKLCDALLNKNYIIHVNRAVVNSKNFKHSASVLHRDLPYQSPTSPNLTAQSITFIHLINGSSINFGGLGFLPGSHKWDYLPSSEFLEKNLYFPKINKGALVIFDSTLLHSASKNKKNNIRRSLVTIFSNPMFKQQINLTKIIKLEKEHKYLKKIKNIKFLLGLTTNPHYSDNEYRNFKIKNKKRINY